MTPLSNQEDRDLLEFADAVNAGQGLQPQNDLEQTYLHVQQAMLPEQVGMNTPPKSWEKIMDTLATSIESHSPQRVRNNTHPPRWTTISSIAAALLLLVVGFGTIRFMSAPSTSSPNSSSTGNHAALVPLGTPAATEIAESQYCSDMTAQTEVKVLEASEARSQPDTDYVSVWLDDDMVMARCPDGSEITLANGMTVVTPGIWPQTITYFAEDPRMLILVHQDVRTGETIRENASTRGGMNLGEHGTTSRNPLQAIISEQDGSQWSIANMDTMTEETLLNLAGLRVHAGQSITATGSADGNAIAIAVSMYETEGSAMLLRVSGAPGDVVVISADLKTAHWLTIPEGMDEVNNISLSDDGSELTFTWDPGLRDLPGESQRVVIDVATGEIISGE